MLRNFFLAILLSCITPAIHAQNDASQTWKTLGKLSWKNYYDEELDLDISQPVFGSEIKALAGREITIGGYIIPIDTEGDYAILSAFPFNNCFFCGGAGPETVMELDMKKDRDLINRYVILKGKLHLNSEDFYQLIYKLEGVELVSAE